MLERMLLGLQVRIWNLIVDEGEMDAGAERT